MTEVQRIEIGPFVMGEIPAPLQYQFQDAAGSPINLSGYTVRFVCKEHDGAASTHNGVLDDGAQGLVHYAWDGTEFATPGHYFAEFWVGNGANRFASWRFEFAVRTAVGPVPVI